MSAAETVLNASAWLNFAIAAEANKVIHTGTLNCYNLNHALVGQLREERRT